LVVFDRWGKKVFEGDANNNFWDGKIKDNELPSADYYYVIELGNGQNYKGTVTLKR
jgi:gliding motility-associated-like protein